MGPKTMAFRIAAKDTGVNPAPPPPPPPPTTPPVNNTGTTPNNTGTFPNNTGTFPNNTGTITPPPTTTPPPSNCNSNQFTCNNGDCIQLNYFCDGSTANGNANWPPDCDDGSDEIYDVCCDRS